MMKGVSQTMWIVVAIVVFLVVALVVVTIFGLGAGNILDATAQRNVCSQSGGSTCAATGILPTNWNIPIQYRQGDQIIVGSCAELIQCGTTTASCSDCGFPIPSGP